MDKDKLILANEQEIELENGASLSDMRVKTFDKEQMLSVWNEMTEENLKEVQIKNGDGVVVANYKDLVLVSETSYAQENGILTSFNLREKTEIEKMREELQETKQSINSVRDDVSAVSDTVEGMQTDITNLTEMQDIQDGAIADLAEAIAEM